MRRNTKAAIIILGIGAAVAGVTAIPPAGPPAEVEEAGPATVVYSSTRGALSVALEASAAGGRPFNPGHQAEAATELTALSPVAAGESAPREGHGATESVIGPDGRTWLRGRTTEYPNSAIGRVDFRQDGRSYWCTGTMVSADTVLTAGHCVHNGRSGVDGWSAQVKFTPGAEGNRAPFQWCRARELFAVPGWFERGNEYHDLGLIRLECRVGETVGWLGYGSVPGNRGLADTPVHVRGYPGDKVWSSLWTMRDRVRVSQARMAFYASDTYGGQSGSPVYRFRSCHGARGPCVLAVHAYGVHPGRAHRNLNHGPRLHEGRASLVAALVDGA